MGCYFDTSLFYHAYSPIEHSDLADWVLKQISPDFPACTSEWCVIEMFRALKKQVNLKRIENEDAQKILDMFLTEMHDWQHQQSLILLPVRYASIIKARKIIFDHNLYAADAIHILSAIEANCEAFITFDRDFRSDYSEIPIINQDTRDFKHRILLLQASVKNERKSRQNMEATHP